MSGWIRVRDSFGAEAIVPADAQAAYEGRGYEIIGGPADSKQELEPDVDFGPAASEPRFGLPEDPAKEELLARLAEMEPRFGVSDDPAKEEIMARLAESEHTFAGAETAQVSGALDTATPEDATAPTEADAVADGSTKE